MAEINGTDQNDFLTGGPENDLIQALAGADSVEAGGGNDTVFGGDGADTLNGGAGWDFIRDGSGGNRVDLGDGDDLYFVSPEGSFPEFYSFEADTVHGGDGSDNIEMMAVPGAIGHGGLDGAGDVFRLHTRGEVGGVFTTGAGNDTVKFYGSDAATEGHVTIRTGAGKDVISFFLSYFQHFPRLDVAAGSGDDWVTGSHGKDTIRAGDGNDVIHANGGDDLIIAGGGHDSIYSGLGDDTVWGNNDAEYYKDTGGANQIDAKGGDDRFELVAAVGQQVDAGSGNDHLTLSLIGEAGGVYIGGAGNDFLSFTGQADGGLITIDLGDGNDTVKFVFDRNDPPAAGVDARVIGYGGAGNDRIETGNNDDVLYGDSGDDFLDGGEGRDSLRGGTGDDEIRGGEDADHIFGGEGDDTLKGGTGNDTIMGGAGKDRVFGRAGDDVLYAHDDRAGFDPQALHRQDSVFGGSGNDTIYAKSWSKLYGGSGHDVFYGGATSQEIMTESGNDTVYAGAGDDYVQATIGDHLIFLGDGNDVVNSQVPSMFGHDTIYGGAGNDDIYLLPDRVMLGFGGAGIDDLGGGYLGDVLIGGSGNDKLYGDWDQWAGSAAAPQHSADLMVFDHGHGHDRIMQFEAGHDVLRIAGAVTARIDGDDTLLETQTGSIRIMGQHLGLEDLLIVPVGGSGDVTFEADGSGVDTLRGTEGRDGISNRHTDGPDLLLGAGGNDFIESVGQGDTVFGGAGDDLIRRMSRAESGTVYAEGGNDQIDVVGANDAAQVLFGGAGEDTITAGRGDDTLYGGRDDDLISGKAGHDKIFGNLGADTLWGNLGSDTIWGGSENDVISGGEGDDKLGGGTGDDQINGGAWNDTLYGGAGDDTLTGGVGGDTLYGGVGDDWIGGDDHRELYWPTVMDDPPNVFDFPEFEMLPETTFDTEFPDLADRLNGGAGHDTLVGSYGDDTLLGGRGDDLLEGGTHDDWLNGGTGDDLLYGQNVVTPQVFSSLYTWNVLGNDTFVFGSDHGNDTIGDFDAAFDTLRIKGEVTSIDVVGADAVLTTTHGTITLLDYGTEIDGLEFELF